MSSVPATTTRAALYARVSTEDQAERQTVEAQVSFLRRYAELHEIPIAGLYVDDGVSGTVPIEERPEGRRLIDDARAGQFSTVIVYRVNRLGRTLRALIGAHDLLETAGVTIQSGTEPFETTSHVGKFVFQLLASLAELDRATTLEQMTRGRDRVAGQGRYTGGPIPFGYALDADRRLVPSERLVEPLGMTEAELVRDIFGRVADGTATLTSESKRLSALAIERETRYAPNRRDGGPAKAVVGHSTWGQTTLGAMVRNPVYRGAGRVESRYGTVERPAPALVDAVVWHAAQQATSRNKIMSKRPGDSDYLLRGLVRCGVCKRSYCGARDRYGAVKYRCNSLRDRQTSATPCYAGQVDGGKLERLVWAEVKQFVADPADYLAAAQQSTRAALGDPERAERTRRRLSTELGGKDAERARVLEMYRRGRITSAECDAQLDAVAEEVREIREQLDAIKTRQEMGAAQEAYLADVGQLIATTSAKIEAIEQAGDRAAMRMVIEGLVPEITILTELEGQTTTGRKRTRTSVRLRLAFGAPGTRALAGVDGVTASTTRRRDDDYHTTFPPLVVVRSLAPA